MQDSHVDHNKYHHCKDAIRLEMGLELEWVMVTATAVDQNTFVVRVLEQQLLKSASWKC